MKPSSPRPDRASSDRREDRTTAAQRDEVQPTPSQAGRGHKAQLAAPHRSGRPSGGNIRTDRDE